MEQLTFPAIKASPSAFRTSPDHHPRILRMSVSASLRERKVGSSIYPAIRRLRDGTEFQKNVVRERIRGVFGDNLEDALRQLSPW